MSTFATAINCIDGRAQAPVRKFLKRRFKVDFVDPLTRRGIVKMLAFPEDTDEISSIKKDFEISCSAHNSTICAIAAHHDCAGNPVSKEEQIEHLFRARATVQSWSFNTKIILLWVNELWLPDAISAKGVLA